MGAVDQDQCNENDKATAAPPRHTSSKRQHADDVKWGGLHIDLRVALLKLKSPMIAATLLRNKNEIF